jgi:hypothetical protein
MTSSRWMRWIWFTRARSRKYLEIIALRSVYLV